MSLPVPEILPKPWEWKSVDLTTQLKREMADMHVLSGKTLKTIARRQDNDDVLFEIDGADYNYAVVHLTWSSKKLKNPSSPHTTLYKNWNDLFINRILIDSEDWED